MIAQNLFQTPTYGNMAFAAQLDRFEWSDYLVSYVYNAASDDSASDEIKANMERYAQRLEQVDSNIIPYYLAESYFNLGRTEDAFRMLKSLQGRAHEVYTGVAVLCCKEGKMQTVRSHAVKTAVYVHEMTEDEIRGYIATGEPSDKAGGYGIQGAFAKYIDRIDGDYYNVVGLPVSFVYQTLKEIGAL